MATVWISALARRSNINETNELNINFVLRRKYNRKNQIKILSYCLDDGPSISENK